MAKKSSLSVKSRKPASSGKGVSSVPSSQSQQHSVYNTTNSESTKDKPSSAPVKPYDDSKDPSMSWSAFTKITRVFLLTKVLLFTLAILAPTAYDTSSVTYGPGMLFETDGSGTLFGSAGGYALRKLTIWDNVFFVDAAARDGSYFGANNTILEQENHIDIKPRDGKIPSEESPKEEDVKYKDISQYSIFDSFDSLSFGWKSKSKTQKAVPWPKLTASNGLEFSSMSQYVYEHEWAFGTGWIYIVKFTGMVFVKIALVVNEFKFAFFASSPDIDVANIGEIKYYYSFASIWLSNWYHYFSCLLLFSLTAKLYNNSNRSLVIRVYEHLSGIQNQVAADANQGTENETETNEKAEGFSTAVQKPSQAASSESKFDQSSSEVSEDDDEPSDLQSTTKKTPEAIYARRMGLTASLLYAISPAGIFLGAGYTESIFAFISFFALMLNMDRKFLASGLFLGISTTLRSNGLLWVFLYVYELFACLRCLYYTSSNSTITQNTSRIYNRLFTGDVWNLVQGAITVTLPFLVVQYFAFAEFCPNAEWCSLSVQKTSPSGELIKKFNLPLIFSYIQAKYWKVGFLEYWTPNNIPNFLFAAPTLYLMAVSNIHFYKQSNLKHAYEKHSLEQKQNYIASTFMGGYVLVSWVLFASALFVWNTQIVTRVATCLPTIYWYVAELLTSTNPKEVKSGKRIAAFFFVWIVAQSILFGAFMPPA